jgi:hypothetical protein
MAFRFNGDDVEKEDEDEEEEESGDLEVVDILYGAIEV